MVALIPARAGSKRVKSKNTRKLNGHPLIDYTIAAANQSGVFSRVVVCSDDDRVFIRTCCSGPAPADYISRPPVPDNQPDIVWVKDALAKLWLIDQRYPEAFAILRPTSPFRTAETIRRAFAKFSDMNDCVDSIRAVEPVEKSPYKMWVPAPYAVKGHEDVFPMKPLLEGTHPDGTPYHSSPTQTLPLVYVQTSALEMAWTRCVEVHGTISGRKVAPFFGTGLEFISIDTEDDWLMAEQLARERPDLLPPVDVARLPAHPTPQ
jgi:CMP-N,N'-diacetyllegionaminic acid synthase